MFLKNSRYCNLDTVTAKDRSGREVQAVTLRRLPATQGTAYSVTDKDQLDVMCEQYYDDPTRFWHIGDANTELEVNELVRETGRQIDVPENS